MLLRACLPLLCVVFACGSKPPLVTKPSSPVVADATTRRHLTIPPNAESLAMMRTLEALSDAGDAEAAWQRAHYLLDLFDAARFAQDEGSRKLLAEIAGRPVTAMRGPAATQAIAELLVLEVDRVLELNRQHRDAQAVRVLASYDAAGPTRRSEVGQAMQELKRVRTRGGVLATNASLRLFAYCQRALDDAQDFGRAGQRVAISHCLYPLFEADPEPYFAPRAEDRPPPPTVDRLLEELRRGADVRDPGRIAMALDAQRDWSQKFSQSHSLPDELDPLSLRLPPASGATPYDDYPLLTPKADAAHLRSLQLADGRHTLAVALASERSGAELLKSASIAKSAGADALALLVAIEQGLRAPPGDYWSDTAKAQSVPRLGQLALSLSTLGVAAPSSRDRPAEAKATSWNLRQAQLSLHLLVTPGRWTLVSPDGRLASIAVGDPDSSPSAKLRSILSLIRDAYPDEQGVILVPQGDVSIGAIVLAADAASHDRHGQPLFSQLAIAAKAPKVRSGTRLLSRLRRRAALQVQVDPPSLSRLAAALRCYQRMADARKPPTGTVRLELGSDGGVTLSTGSARLFPCARDAFGKAMATQTLSAVTVTFSAKTK